MTRMQKIALGMTALAAVVGTGAAVAATRLASPEEESRAVIDDAARRLGIAPERLSAALEEAMKARIDAAVEAGRLTEEEGERLKEMIGRRGVPMRVPGARREREFTLRHFHRLQAAAAYLGMSASELREQLEAGKTLAQVARERGKSVEGLVEALLAKSRDRIEQAVEEGHLTRTQADDLLADLRDRITDRVHGRMPRLPRFHRPDGLERGPRWPRAPPTEPTLSF